MTDIVIEISEHELIKRAKNNDREAFDMLMVQNQESIYMLAYRMLNNRDDALDIVQDTFLRAYKALKSFKEKSSLRHWLETIATRLCISRYRKKRIFIEFESIVGLSQEFEQPQLDREKDAKMLYDAMKTLSSRERAAFVLRMESELSTAEVADRMGIAQGTVKALLHRATNKMRKKLENYYKGT